MEKKRVVVWGTGVVGSMVIAEIVDHPVFELVGVGVSHPDKVGVDAGTICDRSHVGPGSCGPASRRTCLSHARQRPRATRT